MGTATSARKQVAEIRRLLEARQATTRQIAVAIRHEFGYNALLAHRLAMGWTQRQAATEYNNRWPHDPPRTGKHVSYWERWAGPGTPTCTSARTPSHQTLCHLADLYQCTVDDLLRSDIQPEPATGTPSRPHRDITIKASSAVPVGIEPAPVLTGQRVPWTADGALRALHTVTDAGPMDRRLFLLMIGVTTTSPAHEWLIAREIDDTGRAHGSQVPMDVVDHLDQITAQLRQLDDRLGSGRLLALVRQQLHYVTGLIDQCRSTDSVGRRLHGTAAELLRLAGFLSFDNGVYAEAERYWEAALHAAHVSGDRSIGANILGFWSCMAKDRGDIGAAITLADTARAGYPGTNAKVTAILELRVAEAYAHDNATTETRRAIDAAFNALDTVGTSTGNHGWCYWMNKSQAHAQAGYCYLTLGDHPRARDHLLHGLALQQSRYSREGALRQVLLATTYLHQGTPDLDQALIVANRAVDALISGVDSARCIGHVSRLINDLAPYHQSTSVRQFIDHAQPLMAATRLP